MKIYYLRTLKPQNRRQNQICEALKDQREMGFNEISRKIKGLMGRNQCYKEIENLEKQELIFKTDSGKYKLAKAVKCLRVRHDGHLLTIKDFKNIEMSTDWYDLEEIPSPIREELQIAGVYMDFDDYEEIHNNILKTYGIEGFNRLNKEAHNA